MRITRKKSQIPARWVHHLREYPSGLIFGSHEEESSSRISVMKEAASDGLVHVCDAGGRYELVSTKRLGTTEDGLLVFGARYILTPAAYEGYTREDFLYGFETYKQLSRGLWKNKSKSTQINFSRLNPR